VPSVGLVPSRRYVPIGKVLEPANGGRTVLAHAFLSAVNTFCVLYPQNC
jgi:hypothetical protein